MKMKTWINRVPIGLSAIVLLGFGAAAARAAAPALQGQLTLRPLTPQELKDYSLTGKQIASGLNTIGVGQPAYLDALANIAIAPSNIVGVDWALTAKPIGSAASLGQSPLGSNVPTYKKADRLVAQVVGRAMLVPDVTGQYTIAATITTVGSGTTNLVQTVTAGTYLGASACALCHSGGLVASNKFASWSETPHASAFMRKIDGSAGPGFGANCVSCHVVGYDTNTNAVNGGFDDVAKLTGWTFPTTITNGNWAAMPAELRNVSNVQCENCHGPGSEHAHSLGDTSRISKTFAAGDCAQCHDSLSHHSKTAEWNNSRHAVTTRTPSGPTRINCVRCHTAGGFVGYVNNMGSSEPYATNTVYEAIDCQTCHDPHDASKPYQLRLGPTVLLADGVTTVTNAGAGAFCMNCHRSRNGAAANSIEKYPLGQQTWAGGSAFGPHDNPASDMLEGVNGWTYGKVIPSSAHSLSVSNTCVGCHMQEVASSDPAFLQAGGHTFNMTYTNSSGATLDKVDVCVKCHGQISSFDMVKVDYNGDGVIEGVQTEVQHLLDSLSTHLPGSAYESSGNYVADGLVKSRISVKTNWQSNFLKAGYNWQFVNNDLSKGVHNAAYAVGLLKASIGDLTGDSNNDGLPDAWQIQYFGSTTTANAAPNASPAGDGVPNWLKYSLGLDPMVAGVVLPDGVVWANGTGLVNTGGTNTLKIFTAAEVVFPTEAGKSYQLQAVSSLGGGWQNIGAPITGTGATMSYVTPTRGNTQQYFRVQSY